MVGLRTDFDPYADPPGIGADGYYHTGIMPAVDQGFFKNGPVDRLGGRQWAILIDARLLTRDAEKLIKDPLTAMSNTRLNSGPEASWDPAGPAINVTADIVLVNGCPVIDIDMDVQLSIRVSLSVTPPNTLRRHVYLHGTKSDEFEVVACALTAALMWPFVGPLMLADEDLRTGVGEYLGGLAAGPLITYLGLVAAIETKQLSSDISGKLGSSCHKQDDENYECNDVQDLQMALSPPQVSRLELAAVTGVREGLVYSGTVSNLTDVPMGSLDDVHVSPFAWGVFGNCNGVHGGTFQIENHASIRVWSTPPVGLCTARVLFDPAQEFAVAVDPNRGLVEITPRFKPAYVADRYPCQVRVITNRGVRTITLAPPVAITPEEQQNLDGALVRAVASCYAWEKVFTRLEKLRWLPDPQPRVRYLQYWQIVVGNMQPGDSIRVDADAGRTLLSARPSPAGVTHLSVLLPDDEAVAELALELQGERREEDPVREMAVQQVLFEHRAALPIADPVRAVRIDGGDTLVVETEEQQLTWDLAAPERPVLRSATAATHGDGNTGPVVHSGKRLGGPPSSTLLRALELLGRQFGEPLVVGSPRVGGAGETLYLRTDQRAALFDISSAEPREIQTFEQPVWFEGTAVGGKLLARLDPHRNVLDVYAATASRLR
jgi:hypothetical protein